VQHERNTGIPRSFASAIRPTSLAKNAKTRPLKERNMTVADTPIDFDYDLEEIVQMDGRRPHLKRMPDRVGVLSMLHRGAGKTPSFFDAAQIETALLARYRSDFTAGNPRGHREATEKDFE
jgi:hypothetical protein